MEAEHLNPIEQVLDQARWAPSGDNTQPWRFEILSPTAAIVHTFDTRRHCVYDLTGAPSQIAVGALLETARIAASGLGMRADIERLPTPTEEALQFRLQLVADRTVKPSELIPHITSRCTNRRPFSRQPLSAAEKSGLEAGVGTAHEVMWFEGKRRSDIARLMYRSAAIRLTIPEAYQVHRDVIEWNAATSDTRIPDRAVGLDPIGLALMRWAMRSWTRTRVLSTYFGGTLLPRLQLELLPGVGCAAHMLICARNEPRGVDDYLDAGAAVQRMWLTAKSLGLQYQPEMTPLIFADYSRTHREFSELPGSMERANAVRRRIEAICGVDAARRAVWLGRTGHASAPVARSLRRRLADLKHT
jgi:hypothetical protein